MEPSGGWYNTRKQYRSVAFGTWKVGGARQLSQRSTANLHEKTEDSVDANRNYVLGTGYNTIAVTPRSRKKDRGLLAVARPLGESSPNLSRISTGIALKKMEPLRVESVAALSVSDCYSSSEYCEYTRSREDLDANGNSADAAPASVVDRLPRRTSNNNYRGGDDWRLATSLQRVHQRSRSAGADAAWSLSTLASGGRRDTDTTGNMKIKDLSNGNSAPHYASSALRATKRFFKKIYSTATLPGKKNSIASPPPTVPAVPSEHFRVFAPFFDAALNNERFRVEIDDDDEDEEIGVRTEGFENDRIRFDMRRGPRRDREREEDRIRYSDRSSTPNESIESTTLTSKSEMDAATDPPPQQQPETWDDIFLRLKREITAMRERDAAILADLQRVDSQLQSVKAQRAFHHMPNPDQLRPGDLVPSIPL